MSTAARLISGSVASWAQIGVTMASQIVLVPIYLSHWNVKTYGIWLAIQGIMSVLSMLDMGYQNYMGYEFLRLGRKNMPALCKSFWSALIFGVMISLCQILLTILFVSTGILAFFLGESDTKDVILVNAAGVVLILQGISWLAVMTIPGLMVKVLAAFGYYPRMAWWGFVYAIITAVAPLVAVVMGADLLGAGIAFGFGTLLYCLIFYVDLLKLLKKEKIKFSLVNTTAGKVFI